MPPTSTMPGAAKMDTTTSDAFANIIANLKLSSNVLANLNLNGYLANPAAASSSGGIANPALESDSNIVIAEGSSGVATNAKLSTAGPISLPPSLVNQYKSFFKTIKIFVASNKDEFAFETECLLQETQPELQQYFMQYGYDFSFVNVNLNCDFDPFMDPYMFECMNKELEEGYRCSEACFFLGLIGDKYGLTPLPLEMSKSEYENIKKSASSFDFDFFESWYYLDENNDSVCYKLKSLTEAFPNIYNKDPYKNEEQKNDLTNLRTVHSRLAEILQASMYKSESGSGGGLIGRSALSSSLRNQPKLQNDRFLYSGLELLTNVAFKNSPNECLVIGRNIQHLDPTKKTSHKYIDLVSDTNKIDKAKDEKQAQFRDSVFLRLNDENKHHFNIKWKENFDDIAEITIKSVSISNQDNDLVEDRRSNHEENTAEGVNKSEENQEKSQEEANANTGAPPANTDSPEVVVESEGNKPAEAETTEPASPSNLNKYDPDFKRYLQNFNAVIVSKIKTLVEKKLQEESQLTSRPYEISIYQEATRHLYKLQSLVQENMIDSSDYMERFKRLINVGVKGEHYPIFLYGGSTSGKTCSVARYGLLASRMIDPCMLVVRFFNLTSQCSNFESLLYSICEQLSISQKLNPHQEIKSKELSHLVEYFYKICSQISSRSKSQVLILVDGLTDIYVEKSQLNNLSLGVWNDQISWLFTQQLPARVHLIVSIKRSAELLVGGNSGGASTSGSVPLFLHHFSEKLSSESDNYLFELPIQLRKNESGEIVGFIQSELSRVDRKLKDTHLQAVVSNLFNTKADSSSSVSIDDKNGFLYLSIILKEIINANKLNNNLDYLLQANHLPKDLDSLLTVKLEFLEKKFNTEALRFIICYITAARNGITEMELIDLLSCNNEFFTHYYSNTDLPMLLRFPVFQWLIIKYQLSSLLTCKYMDNKLTICWSHEVIRRYMRQRYFSKFEKIKSCHKDIANYFLEAFVVTKPLVDMNRNMQLRDEEGRRYLAQQPLLYSETLYNSRRLSELWFHLLFSGDGHRLKECALFNFEYLLSKCYYMPLQMLLDDLDVVLKQKLDPDILLINSLLMKCYTTLTQDPLRLSSEILSRLKPLQQEYGDYVMSLVAQANEWCEQNDSPVLMPLSTWLESPEMLLVSKIQHSDEIKKIAVTSYNQHLFFTTPKNEIVMYHIPSKRFKFKFPGHADTINSLQISHDNRYLVTVSSDKLVKIWNLTTGEEENAFSMHKAAILCSVLAHNSQHLITGTDDRLVNVVDIESGEMIHSEEKHFDAVTHLALSTDDVILISASLDRSVKRWLYEDMQVIDVITTVYSPIVSMVITFDNTFVILALENNSVQVKTLLTGMDVHELQGHNSAVTCLAVSNDSDRVYVACADAKLYLYHVISKELLAVLCEQETSISDLRVSSDSSFLFSSSGRYLYVLNLKKKYFVNNNKRADPLFDENKYINAIALSKEGDLGITGDASGNVSLWNLQDGELVDSIIEPRSATDKYGVCKVALSGSYLFSVAAFTNNTISVYDNELGEVALDFVEHLLPVKYMFIIDNNRKILSSDGIDVCKIWLSHTGQLLETINVACSFLALSPDARYVVSGPGENTAKIWLLSDARVIRTIDHPENITAVTFTHDSQFVITGGQDSSCKIWELSTGKLNQVLIEHEGPVTSIAVPFSNNLVVSGSQDKLAILWNFKDGSVMHKLSGHQDTVVKVAVAFDGIIVISASKDGVINVWSVRHGVLLNSLNLQFTLVDMVVSTDCSRMIARLESVASVPIIGLTYRRLKEAATRTLSQASLKSFDDIKLPESGRHVLPIKPKPLLYQRESNMFKVNSVEFSGLPARVGRRHSEAISKMDTQFEGMSTSQSGSRSVFNKARRKTKKSGDFSSTASIVHASEEKPKKTKICCLI